MLGAGRVFQHGVQAVLYCAYMGHAEALDVLLDAGADPNSSDGVRDHLRGALLRLCIGLTSHVHVRWCVWVLVQGGDTVLMWAVRSGSERMVSRLVRHGVDVKALNKVKER